MIIFIFYFILKCQNDLLYSRESTGVLHWNNALKTCERKLRSTLGRDALFRTTQRRNGMSKIRIMPWSLEISKPKS